MTLVLANLDSGRFSIKADTRLTKAERNIETSRSSRTKLKIPGALKIFIVDPQFCFAYSGIEEIAHIALRKILRNQRFKRHVALKIIREAHKESYRTKFSKTDFIVCDRRYSQLIRFTDGRREVCHSGSRWIGDIDAYTALRGDINNFGKVLHDEIGSVGSIGGIHFSANDNHGFFEYEGKLVRTSNGNEGSPHDTGFQDISQGGFYCATVVPERGLIPCVAVYIHEAGLGYFYDYRGSNQPSRIYAHSITLFLEKLEHLTGKKFWSLAFSKDRTPVKEGEGCKMKLHFINKQNGYRVQA